MEGRTEDRTILRQHHFAFRLHVTAAPRTPAAHGLHAMTRQEENAAAVPVAGDHRRLMSVDALRGFDMFWIVGAEALVYAFNRMSRTPVSRWLETQLQHTAWAGFHFLDLVFPLFVFIVGVSLVFSLTKTLARGGRRAALWRITRRSVVLFLLGVFLYGGCANRWPNIRLLGVLNRIALAYFFSGVLFCYCRPRALAAVCIGLLAGYWALMTFVPIRDFTLTRKGIAAAADRAGDAATAVLFRNSASNTTAILRNPVTRAQIECWFLATTNRVTGRFDAGLNLANHVDYQYLPGRKWDKFYDPEGLLSTLPAVATCLLGVFAGLLLQSRSVGDRRKVQWLLGGGAALAALGWLWHLQFPVIKQLWTSSYVLVAGGYSALLLGAFYLLVDVWQWRRWCQPFVWIGMNAITIYVVTNILGGFSTLSERLAGGDVREFLDLHVAKGCGDLVIALLGLWLMFAFVRLLYRRQVFLRL